MLNKSVDYNVILNLVNRIFPIFDDHCNFSQRPFILVWGTVFLRRMTPETESETAFPRNTLRFSQLNLNLEIDTLEYKEIESRQKNMGKN